MNDDADINSDELEAIARSAARLPLLAPSRDLWSGIEARIGTRVVELPVEGIAPAPARHSWRRLAVAASLLVAATAGVTYSIMKHGGTAGLAANDSATVQAPLPGAKLKPVSMQSPGQVTEQTFDREIGAMRKIIDERGKDLDPATIVVLRKNLKLIDAAIAESKAALAKDSASAFLLDRLTHAYETKLQLLRGVANIPAHG
jgi:hypothetical protein